MLDIFDFAREMTLLGVGTRMLMACICGGLIGIEREFKRRPAGFRTHILICLGAATTILTNLYLYQVLHLYTDVARLGAQVIVGVGFIGAGTIIVTKRQRVKGLTTAAGLWIAAIIGLVCGAGYLECAIAATALVLIAELLLIKLEYRFARKIKDVNLYIEYAHSDCINQIMQLIHDFKVKVGGLEVTRVAEDGQNKYCAIVNLHATKHRFDGAMLDKISTLEGVINLEEL